MTQHEPLSVGGGVEGICFAATLQCTVSVLLRVLLYQKGQTSALGDALLCWCCGMPHWPFLSIRVWSL